jgi:hypothetical protein
MFVTVTIVKGNSTEYVGAKAKFTYCTATMVTVYVLKSSYFALRPVTTHLRY